MNASAVAAAGAIFVGSAATVVVTNGSKITSCSAAEGGGLDLDGGTLIISNGSSISDCTAQRIGGAMSVVTGDVTVANFVVIA
eukprot:7381462-Prymnesium_polylepis.1